MNRLGMDPPNVALSWREWLGLPQLGIPWIKCKIDTGARTSALHTRGIVLFTEQGVQMVRFEVHLAAIQNGAVVACCAQMCERRWVMDSGGHKEWRYVIVTPVRIGDQEIPIEMTLTDRDPMRFKMLLGRTGIPKNTVIYPHASYLLGKPDRL